VRGATRGAAATGRTGTRAGAAIAARLATAAAINGAAARRAEQRIDLGTAQLTALD